MHISKYFVSGGCSRYVVNDTQNWNFGYFSVYYKFSKIYKEVLASLFPLLIKHRAMGERLIYADGVSILFYWQKRRTKLLILDCTTLPAED